jgi:hypothetical protein
MGCKDQEKPRRWKLANMQRRTSINRLWLGRRVSASGVTQLQVLARSYRSMSTPMREKDPRKICQRALQRKQQGFDVVLIDKMVVAYDQELMQELAI